MAEMAPPTTSDCQPCSPRDRKTWYSPVKMAPKSPPAKAQTTAATETAATLLFIVSDRFDRTPGRLGSSLTREGAVVYAFPTRQGAAAGCWAASRSAQTRVASATRAGLGATAVRLGGLTSAVSGIRQCAARAVSGPPYQNRKKGLRVESMVGGGQNAGRASALRRLRCVRGPCRIVVLILGVVLGTGCAAPQVRTAPATGTRTGAVTADRERLLDDLAACQLLRLTQAHNAPATDAAVLAALDRYRVTPEQLRRGPGP